MTAETILTEYWKKHPLVYGDQFGRILGLTAAIWKRQGKDHTEVCAKVKTGVTATTTGKLKEFLKETAERVCRADG